MIQEVSKSPKIALCRKCRGIGYYRHIETDCSSSVRPCPQCEGSGRVLVSCKMHLDIRPYKPIKKS
nr:MAG TPA: antitermination protein [Caudoviricetes sp.]